jgi:peptidyl-prolyl cis-trans isomerase B (cyclophilin B)
MDLSGKNYLMCTFAKKFDIPDIMKRYSFLLMLLLFVGIAAGNAQENKPVKIKISTGYGDMVAVLYNETPQHRDNFVKLIKEGWYEGSPFHRVIKDFMIQGGQNADGRVSPGYTVPAEFSNDLYHKKGALAAARQGDQVNPMKESSGCQFYIVQGRLFDENSLYQMSQRSGFSYSDKAIKDYTTLGGTPHLDGGYTVFGEVISGLEVVDKIAAVQTGEANKPVKEIKMTVSIVQ